MLEEVIAWMVGKLLPAGSSWQEPLSFFLYDTIKILLLLGTLIFLMGVLRTYIPTEKVKQWLAKRKGAHLYAALFGVATPFCSCSSIPIFMGFLSAGVPVGVAFSFLITSPLVNEYLLTVMAITLGWKVTVAYLVIGIVLGVLGGIALGTMGLENDIEADFAPKKQKSRTKTMAFRERLAFGWQEASSIIRKLWLWVAGSVALGALIHNYVPQQSVQTLLSAGGVFVVPLAVLLGIPFYASCAAILPIAIVLLDKGVPVGTATAFMMATVALSLPEAILLRKAIKLRAIAWFFAIVAVGIMLSGYLLNAIG